MKPCNRIVALLFLVSTFYNCNKDNPENESLSKSPPSFPQSQEFDLNSDQNIDFKVTYGYFTWDGINTSGDGISGQLIPVNQNMILSNSSSLPLFLQYNDTIKADVLTPLYWRNYQTEIVTISTTADYFWPKYWSARSPQKRDSYYLGVKVINNNAKLIGWLKFQVDTTNGSFSISDKSFTDKNFIVAGK